MLLGLVLVPLIGGVLAWVVGRRSRAACRWLVAVTLGVDLLMVAALWLQTQPAFAATGPVAGRSWLAEFDTDWIPRLGIRLHFAIDGLSLLLVGLTSLLGLATVVATWQDAGRREPFFSFNLLWLIGAIMGVFLAVDLFLFYVFWEMMLVPTYLLFLWGRERRLHAALKFFIFTQAGGFLLLLAILGLYFAHGQSTGIYTFDYPALLDTRLPPTTALLLMLGFFIGFAVKLPSVPFHTWLPDAYAESPLPATIILSALMAKTGGYGMLRFVVPLFPDAARDFAPIAMGLGVAGILYGGLLAFAQSDVKRLVAFSSLSHMGFVILGIFAWNALAVQGAIMQMLAHGISVSALFILAGMLYERTGTFDITKMGGLWSVAPRMSGTLLFFALATLGLPGLGNFVAEFLILIGTYRASAEYAAIGAFGIVVSAVYALWMIQRTVQGPSREAVDRSDLRAREGFVLGALVFITLILGLAPQSALNAGNQALGNLGIGAGNVGDRVPGSLLVSSNGQPVDQVAP